jgi:ABC-2 type transport system permease protein
VLAAGLAYLPAELVLAGLAVALFGLAPKAFPLAWATFAGTTFVALLGAGLRLPGWVLDLAPTTHVGHPPDGTVAGTSLLELTLLGLTLLAAAFIGFRRRGIPQG